MADKNLFDFLPKGIVVANTSVDLQILLAAITDEKHFLVFQIAQYAMEHSRFMPKTPNPQPSQEDRPLGKPRITQKFHQERGKLVGRAGEVNNKSALCRNGLVKLRHSLDSFVGV